MVAVSVTAVSLAAAAAEVQITGKNVRENLIAKTTYPGVAPKSKVELTVRMQSATSDHADSNLSGRK